MNLCRRISFVSGSFNHLWWKMVATPASGRTTVAAPFSTRVGISSFESAPPIKADLCDDRDSDCGEKVQIFQKLRSLTVETIDLIIKNEEKKGVLVTQEDLIKWAKRLKNKNNKPENALEIFRWMDSKNMEFSPKELALYVDLIAEVEGSMAASDYFDKVDPDYDSTDPNAKNWPAYSKLMHSLRRGGVRLLVRRLSASGNVE